MADILEYFGPHSKPWLTRFVARMAGYYNRPAMPPDWRFTFRDRASLRRSLDKILSWDFDRVILAHGKLIENDARRIFLESYRWALDG